MTEEARLTFGERVIREAKLLRTLFVVCAVTVAADQATKIWAVHRLKFSCRTLGTPSAALALDHCAAASVTAKLTGVDARSVSFLDVTTAPTPVWSAECADGIACVRGAFAVGTVPAGAKESLTSPVALEPNRIYELRAETSGGRESLRFILQQANETRRERIVVVPGFFDLVYVENPGAAWSLFRDQKWEGFRTPFFHAISILAIIFIVYYYRKTDRRDRLMRVVLGLVLGGAVGNYIDRIRFNYVVDFIDWYVDGSGHTAPCTGANHWPGCPAEHHWPTFNVADIAIVVGVVLLLIQSILHRRKEKRAKAAKAGTP